MSLLADGVSVVICLFKEQVTSAAPEDVIAMVTPTMHCTRRTFRKAGLWGRSFNPLPCRSALVKPTLLAQKENKQNRTEWKTRVKVSEDQHC